jgi:hypothetical protein
MPAGGAYVTPYSVVMCAPVRIAGAQTCRKQHVWANPRLKRIYDLWRSPYRVPL